MVAPSDVPKRRNGMSPPYSMPQVASWVFLGSTAIHFILFITPILPLGASVSLTIIFFLLIGVVIYFGMRAIAIDSMDIYLKKALCEQRNGDIKQESNLLNRLYSIYNGGPDTIKNQKAPDDEETKQCWICDIQVAEHSMHCKYCNKCVSHFDHHCLWLNTCIGEKNYWDFYKVMWSIAMMQVVHLSISCGLVIDIFMKGPTDARADAWFGESTVAAFLFFFIVFDICSLVLLAQLIAFHIHLQREQITTYQFIVRDSKKRREKSKLLQDLYQQRLSELARAKQERQHWYTFRLKCGEKCRQWGCGVLDPLEMPQPPPPPDPNAGFGAALGGAPINKTGPPEQPSDEDDENDMRNGDDASDSANAIINGGTMNGKSEDANYSQESEDHENGISFLPVAIGIGMSSERHDLDSLPSHSDAEVSLLEADSSLMEADSSLMEADSSLMEADSSLMETKDDDTANADISFEKHGPDNSLAVLSEVSEDIEAQCVEIQRDPSEAQSIETHEEDVAKLT